MRPSGRITQPSPLRGGIDLNLDNTSGSDSYTRGIVRRLTTVVGLTALLWSFAQAPFLHVHAEDHDDSSGSIHSHLHLYHGSPTPTIAEADEEKDAIDLVWGISAPNGIHLSLNLFLLERFVIPEPLLAGVTASNVALHSHDPPNISSQNPRGPPA